MLYESGFDSGQKVNTPLGPGVVQYKRMAPPDFCRAATYSVRLDSKAFDPMYNGTIFTAEQVVAITKGNP
jgi:hypothetical protein